MRPARPRRVERAREAGVQESLSEDCYNQVLGLEHQLLTTIQFKGPFDPNASILRRNIRELYESIILEDHEFAESHDVEQSLWRLHHTCIEEYRSCIRKNTASAGTAAPGNKSVVRREPIQKVKAVFRTYLAEATGFYHDLFLKIGAKYGVSQEDLMCSLVTNKSLKKDDKRVAELRRCQHSCHRCLIFLGDLARYKECCGDGDTRNYDWSIAAGFYVRAASMLPSSGNPYNQLAVLATYIGDEMLAVYNYFRSLASEIPFLTAKENLFLLFEKNRHSYLRLAASSAEKSFPFAKSKTRSETQVLQVAGTENSGVILSNLQSSEQMAYRMELLKGFRVRFVRLNGVLFTRTSLEAFSEVHSSVLSDLQQLLMIKETDEEEMLSPISLTSGRNWGTGPNVLLQLISILIFSVHNINMGSGPESHQPTYAEILQRSVVLAYALVALFDCGGYILQHCARLDDPSCSLFLPGIVVLMEWLSCRPEITMGNEIKEKEATARMFFWRNCVCFLNKFTVSDFGPADRDDIYYSLSLWEDFELYGFTPLLPIQHKLDNGKKPDVGPGSLRERQARVKRLKHAGKVIADMFSGADKGMQYDMETDSFYLMGEKKCLDREKIDLDQAACVDNHEVLLMSIRDDENSKQASEPEAVSPKFSLPEEEDEEVIIFNPSSISRALSITLPTDFPGSKPSNQKVSNGATESLISSTQLDVPLESRNSQLMESDTLFMAVPATVPSAASISPLLCGDIPKPSEPTDWATYFSGSANDSSSQVLKMSSFDSNSEDGSLFQVPLLDGCGLLDTDSEAAGSQFQPGQPLGLTVDWGVAGFCLQPPRNLIASSVNWQLDNGHDDNSLWSTNFQKLASSNGPESGSNVLIMNGFSSMDPSLGLVQCMAATAAPQVSSEAPTTPSQSITQFAQDALAQIMPKLQDNLNLITEDDLGSYEVTEGLGLLDAKLKVGSEILFDSEKPPGQVNTLPSNMRPPPGFGPLPVKSSTTLPASLAFQTSKPALSMYSCPSVSGQQGMALEQVGALSGEERIDDYTWLDGYTPPKKETNLSSLLGLGRTTFNTNNGGPTGEFDPLIDATSSPFPGMKTLDWYSSPPPTLGAWQQSPPSQALLRQELLHIRQLQEQYQQKLLQEKSLQQFYNSQIATQRLHIKQADQQPPPPSVPQQPLVLHQQMPLSLWSGQNSFVS